MVNRLERRIEQLAAAARDHQRDEMPPVAPRDEHYADDHEQCDQYLRAEIADADEDRLAGLRAVHLEPSRHERVEARERALLGELVGDGEERPGAGGRQGQPDDSMEAEVRSRVQPSESRLRRFSRRLLSVGSHDLFVAPKDR